MKIPSDMDLIDLCVCRTFEISPEILLTDRRIERLALARFTAMYIRRERGMAVEQIAAQYRRDINTVQHALRRVTDLLQYNKPYRDQFDRCMGMIDANRVPYDRRLLRRGAKVWTRTDSVGNCMEGTVTSITAARFRVGSFEDPRCSISVRVEDGRLSPRYESSSDVVFIEPPPPSSSE